MWDTIDAWPFQIAFTFTCGTIGAFFLLLGAAVEADGREARTRENDRMVLVWFALATGFLLAALVPPAAWVARAVARNEDAMVAALGDPVVVPAALAVGVALFWLRERWRFAYGLLETFASVVAVTAAVLVAPGLLGKVAGLLSGVYVLVRGLDNMRQAPPSRLRWLKRALLPDGWVIPFFHRDGR